MLVALYQEVLQYFGLPGSSPLGSIYHPRGHHLQLQLQADRQERQVDLHSYHWELQEDLHLLLHETLELWLVLTTIGEPFEVGAFGLFGDVVDETELLDIL